MHNRHLGFALLAASGLALAACSGDTAPSATASADVETAVVTTEPAAPSVDQALEDTDGLQTIAEALKVTGIAGAFKGNGSYTLLAPEDDAFATLGDAGKDLIDSSDHAALAALIRNHMLPGYVTPQDLGAAIDASGNGQVTLTTLGGSTLVFARSNDTITVTAPDGSQADLDGDPITGGSSLAVPITGVLRKID
ncbi:fasciclin domain-containing protein [Novosphingobium mangrovi (ex Huang et al. 2023)]|uniref:Fasciclin domain-containing protein n=1 Tax=Novosphingobium mangrovi (ex Huang et al. 2023) TaxID=2976432 RepID=A0ABT2I8J9_9SPHN|nr:fasciclin domain-containing protein [Novosphingobium mangrovi (ex Huang et al. 2023)]MCT2401147.1 fasciclin domain-containing protein [Novosphingobium mangrovi (ex Huang et al. 2023)]